MKLFNFIGKHKILMAIIVAILIIGGYFLYISMIAVDEDAITYETEEVVISDIQKIVSGSGQVEDANQVDITADASGQVTKVLVEENQEVSAGDLLFQLDSEDLVYSVNSAKYDLETAQVVLQQMKEPVDRSDILKAENSIQTAQDYFASLQLALYQQQEAAEESRDQAKDWLDDHDESDAEYYKYYNQERDSERAISELEKNGPAQLDEARADIVQKEAALADLKAGPSANDIELQEIKVQKAQNSLSELNSRWADYQVKAPFDGIITDISVSVGDTVSSSGTSSQTSSASSNANTSTSSSGGLAVLLTGLKKATIVVNEVDIPEVKIGQDALLTLDAISDLEIIGQVASIDEIGTVDQGVVSHNVEVSFSAQDVRIKSGMSVNADIVVISEDDIIVVSSASIKVDENGNEYVQILEKSGLGQSVVRRVDIEVGVSNDTQIEIIAGLEIGDEVIIREIVSTEAESSDDQKDDSILPGVPGQGMGSSFRQ